MHKIADYALWIGTAADARNARAILDHEIRAVLQLAYEEPPVHTSRDVLLVRIPLIDGAANEEPLLTLAITVLANLIREEIPTVVCCGGGMSRSPAIAAAALAVTERVSLDECLRHVTANYPADVSTTFWAQVRAAVGDGRG